MSAEVRRDGGSLPPGVRTGKPAGAGQASSARRRQSEHGTTQLLMPDATIFDTLDYNFDTLAQRFREMAYLTKGLRIIFVDERGDQEIDLLLRGRHQLVRAAPEQERAACCTPAVLHARAGRATTSSRWRMQYTDAYDESIYSFANNINTIDGGTHLTGFRGADAHDQRLRAQERHAQGERRQPHRRRRARGPDGDRQRQAAGAAVRGRRPRSSWSTPRSPAQSQSVVDEALAAATSKRTRRTPGGSSRSASPPRAPATRPARRATWSAQERAGEVRAARQAGRLLGARPGAARALHRRGRLGRRLGQAGPRPALPGDPAAARQDPERREGRASTRCCQNNEIRALITALGTASATSSTLASCATTGSSS